MKTPTIPLSVLSAALCVAVYPGCAARATTTRAVRIAWVSGAPVDPAAFRALIAPYASADVRCGANLAITEVRALSGPEPSRREPLSLPGPDALRTEPEKLLGFTLKPEAFRERFRAHVERASATIDVFVGRLNATAGGQSSNDCTVDRAECLALDPQLSLHEMRANFTARVCEVLARDGGAQAPPEIRVVWGRPSPIPASPITPAPAPVAPTNAVNAHRVDAASERYEPSDEDPYCRREAARLRSLCTPEVSATLRALSSRCGGQEICRVDNVGITREQFDQLERLEMFLAQYSPRMFEPTGDQVRELRNFARQGHECFATWRTAGLRGPGFLLIGRADLRGEPRENRVLSGQRAQRLVQLLEEEGVPATLLSWTRFGEEVWPLDAADTQRLAAKQLLPLDYRATVTQEMVYTANRSVIVYREFCLDPLQVP